MKSSPRSFACPVCGEEVSPNAKACPECGACDRSGWQPFSEHEDGLDLPDEEFDYGQFVAEEFEYAPAKRVGQWGWWLVTVVLLLALAALFFPW